MQERNQFTPSNPAERETESTRSRRGFAAMDPEKQKQIASKGGRAAHEQGVAHKWNSTEAREAGRKGGLNSRGGGRTRNDSEEIL